MTWKKNNENFDGIVESLDDVTRSVVVFEDDGKVAYAYLIQANQIVADVWLYNCIDAPIEPEWDDPSNMPFTNPRNFVVRQNMEPITDAADVKFEWLHDEQDNLTQVAILLRGELFGRLTPTSRPGWSKLASKSGPLAKRLEDF